MHRTTGDAHVANMFDDGLPGVDDGTELEQDWVNAVQEELVGLVEEAGLVPTLGDWDQVSDALHALFVDRQNDQNAIDGDKEWLGEQAFANIVEFFDDVTFGAPIDVNAAIDIAGGSFSTNIPLSGGNPAGNAAVVNAVTPLGILKAWATITFNNTVNPGIDDSLNITSVTQDVDGTLHVTIAGDMANDDYGVICYCEQNPRYTGTVGSAFKAVGAFEVEPMYIPDGTNPDRAALAGIGSGFNIFVFGRQ